MIKPDLKGYTLYVPIYTTFWKDKSIRSENRSVVVRNGEGFDTRDVEEFFCSDGSVRYHLGYGAVTWLCVFINAYETEY